MRRGFFVAFVVAAVLLARPASTQPAAVDVRALLDHYEAGRFDQALAPVRNLGEGQVHALRAQLVSMGRLWIEAPGRNRANRMAVAATFALESEAIRAERGDWAAPNDAYCSGRCVIEWACALFFERDLPPDQLEHEWFAATLTLASGVRDWMFVHSPAQIVDPFGESRGHAGHALSRFPGDSRFRFVRAIAMASRFETTTEQDVPREGKRLEQLPAQSTVVLRGPGGVSFGQQRSAASIRRDTQRTLTLKELEDLGSDPIVGASARTRAAVVRWAAGEYEAALAAAEAAASQTADADEQYLARYVAGLSAQSSGALAKAESLYASALEARPHSQSASLALAALVFQRGDASTAYALSQDSLTKRKNDDDPWRLLQYGDYAKMPRMIDALRQTLKSAVSR
jgi:hypothetical protein